MKLKAIIPLRGGRTLLRRWVIAPVLLCSMTLFGCANAAAMDTKLMEGEEASVALLSAYFWVTQVQQSSCSRQGLSAANCLSVSSSCNFLLLQILSVVDTKAYYSRKAINDCAGIYVGLTLTTFSGTSSPCQLAFFNSSCLANLKKYTDEDRATYLGENLK